MHQACQRLAAENCIHFRIQNRRPGQPCPIPQAGCHRSNRNTRQAGSQSGLALAISATGPPPSGP